MKNLNLAVIVGAFARACTRIASHRSKIPLGVVWLISVVVLRAEGPQTLHSTDVRGNALYVHGAPTTPGETKEKDQGRTVELVAHGTEFGGHCNEDQGRFAYAVLEGDFDVSVQVASVTNNGATHFYDSVPTLARAGLMARESDEPNARFVGIWAVSNDSPGNDDDGFVFDVRKVPGAWLGNQPEGVEAYRNDPRATYAYGYVGHGLPKPFMFERRFPNVWLRLQRKGQVFSAWLSHDGGRVWEPTTTPSVTIDFAKKLHVGVALAAAGEGKPDARAEAVFKNLRGLEPVTPPTTIDGPIKVSANGRYFVTATGAPFFWLGDTAWPLFVRYKQEDAEAYLRDRGARGFTVVHAHLTWGGGHTPDATTPPADTHGDTPWLNNDPATPNEAYFKHVDHLIQYANQQGLVVALGAAEGYFVVDNGTINRANARAYGRWLGNRYKDAPNLVWVNGGDRIPLMFEDVYRELALGLKEGSGGRQLISYHPSGWRSSSEYFHEETWLDFNTIQTWGFWPQVYNAVISDALRTPARPVVLGEGAYEEGPEYPLGPITPLVVRRQAWWTVMAGGSFTYGHTQMWEMQTGWKSAFAAAGANHVCMMRKILNRVKWWEMIPDQGLFLTGVGSERTLNTALRAKNGESALIYLSSQCHVLINFEKLKIKRVNAYWIDPLTGNQTDAGTYETGNYNGRPFPDRASAYFTTPDYWEDALLLIEDAATQ